MNQPHNHSRYRNSKSVMIGQNGNYHDTKCWTNIVIKACLDHPCHYLQMPMLYTCYGPIFLKYAVRERAEWCAMETDDKKEPS
jgi:hypothetical protein